MTDGCPDPAHRGSRWPALLAAGLVVVALSAGAGGAASAAVRFTDERDPQGNLTVEVADGSPNPTPSPTRTNGNGPPFTPPGPSSTTPPRLPGRVTPATVTPQVTQATIPDPVDADEALGDDPVSTGGVLAMSGITATVEPSLEVGNGTLTLDVVVRNTSDSTFDSTAHFWIDHVAGGILVDLDEVDVDALAPDETRRVMVEVDGLGQHVVLRTYMTLTPPESLDGMPLSPLSRNKVVVIPPLFAMSVASGIVAIGGLMWWAVSPRGLGLRWRRWGA
ncbi:hypothetical protein JNB63_14070 [Microbacterium trichothecenolyticum]|uniref:hypothetical protein n=1 Tax=Microbacterium trichothecenolyticum TaxID=69370 RepID=UPI001C6E8217|nr:hypothetical protein [Microbacterium trichothecenolyticum]MBW9121221.1 hypothetical protein [Microbacterium trichothecenolyticum]